MPAGLQVFNNSGIVQIDQDWLNFALVEKGSVGLNSALGGGWGSAYYGEFTRAGLINPVVAFRANSDQRVSILNTLVSGSNRTFRFVGRGGETVTWYLFDSVDVSGISSGAGFEVYRGDGVRAFHSDVPPMRVVGQMDGGSSLSVSASRDHAIIQSGTRINKLSINLDVASRRDTRITMPYFNSAGTSLLTENVLMNSQSVALEGEYSIVGPQIRVTAIDVTHL